MIENERNKMSNIYIGYIVEAIYIEDTPTFDLRIRIPSLHGLNSANGVADADLPIARPLLMPGTILDIERFENFVGSVRMVYVILEFGDLGRPVYLGLRSNFDSYSLEPIESLYSYVVDLIEEITGYIIQEYTEDILVSADTIYTITHALATEDVIVTLKDLSDNRLVDTEVEVVDGNNIKIHVGSISAPMNLRVFIIG